MPLLRRRRPIAAPPLLAITRSAEARDPARPSRPMRIVVAHPPRGGTGLLARALAEGLRAATPMGFPPPPMPAAELAAFQRAEVECRRAPVGLGGTLNKPRQSW